MTQKTLTLSTRITKDGRLWIVSFRFTNRRNIRVTARDVKGKRTLSAPKDAKEIIDIFPIEYWPAFAVPLANLLELPLEIER